jgi:hypothetical protein
LIRNITVNVIQSRLKYARGLVSRRQLAEHERHEQHPDDRDDREPDLGGAARSHPEQEQRVDADHR